jgi:hypothetical protein
MQRRRDLRGVPQGSTLRVAEHFHCEYVVGVVALPVGVVHKDRCPFDPPRRFLESSFDPGKPCRLLLVATCDVGLQHREQCVSGSDNVI